MVVPLSVLPSWLDEFAKWSPQVPQYRSCVPACRAATRARAASPRANPGPCRPNPTPTTQMRVVRLHTGDREERARLKREVLGQPDSFDVAVTT